MSEKKSTIVDIPPDRDTVSDISIYAPDATDESTFGHAETFETGREKYYWERIQVSNDGMGERLRLKLTVEQMRRWVDLFEDYVHRRNKALSEQYADAWCIYAVTVETWPPGMTDAQVRKSDRDPLTSRVVATCWTETSAHEVKASVYGGEHPDFDPLDFDKGRHYVRISTVPILSEGQSMPWSDIGDNEEGN